MACIVLVLATTLLLLNPNSSNFNENYKEGDVLTRTIVVPADISAVDTAATESRKAAARENTPPIFNFDSSRTETSVQSFVAGWEDLKQKVAPNQEISEAEIDRLSAIIRAVGDGYIYDDADAERLQNDIVLIDARDPSAQLPRHEDGPARNGSPHSRDANNKSRRLDQRTKIDSRGGFVAAYPAERRVGPGRDHHRPRNSGEPGTARRHFAETRTIPRA